MAVNDYKAERDEWKHKAENIPGLDALKYTLDTVMAERDASLKDALKLYNDEVVARMAAEAERDRLHEENEALREALRVEHNSLNVEHDGLTFEGHRKKAPRCPVCALLRAKGGGS